MGLSTVRTSLVKPTAAPCAPSQPETDNTAPDFSSTAEAISTATRGTKTKYAQPTHTPTSYDPMFKRQRLNKYVAKSFGAILGAHEHLKTLVKNNRSTSRTIKTNTPFSLDNPKVMCYIDNELSLIDRPPTPEPPEVDSHISTPLDSDSSSETNSNSDTESDNDSCVSQKMNIDLPIAVDSNKTDNIKHIGIQTNPVLITEIGLNDDSIPTEGEALTAPPCGAIADPSTLRGLSFLLKVVSDHISVSRQYLVENKLSKTK